MKLLLRLIVNAFALMVVAYLLKPGVEVVGGFFPGAIVAAIVLGIANAILRPILVLLSLPLEILTLGLFTIVINAALFWLVGHLGVGLEVHGFVAALIGAIILAIVSFLASLVLGDGKRDDVRDRRR
jgi:putative membrane protein